MRRGTRAVFLGENLLYLRAVRVNARCLRRETGSVGGSGENFCCFVREHLVGTTSEAEQRIGDHKYHRAARLLSVILWVCFLWLDHYSIQGNN